MISGAYLLETHITGIRAHGRKTLMALDCNDFRHDSNLTIEIILRMLMLLRVCCLVFVIFLMKVRLSL